MHLLWLKLQTLGYNYHCYSTLNIKWSNSGLIHIELTNQLLNWNYCMKIDAHNGGNWLWVGRTICMEIFKCLIFVELSRTATLDRRYPTLVLFKSTLSSYIQRIDSMFHSLKLKSWWPTTKEAKLYTIVLHFSLEQA